jgi:hypothetical protein
VKVTVVFAVIALASGMWGFTVGLWVRLRDAEARLDELEGESR